MDNTEKLYKFFNRLDRSIFIDSSLKAYSEYDGPLPIGYGQTISQPSLVYAMTRYLELDKESRVLEIGTGSGYQTAYLAEFSKKVYTVEKIGKLSEKARDRLTALGYANISYRIGDGSEGWPEYSPFDRIIVTAAASVLPETLVSQLAPEGVMIIPVGSENMQELMKVRKDGRGSISSENLCGVRFVELKGRYGWKGGGRTK